MRVLLATSCLASHHHAMTPFGWAAASAGHEVRLATTPDLVAAAARTGLPVVPVGPAVDFPALHRELLRAAREGGARYDPKSVFCAVADTMAEGLLAFARGWRPDLVVWDPGTLAAPLAAAAVGARSVRFLWGVDMLGRGATPSANLPEAFAALHRRFGLEAPEDPDWWTLDPTPRATWPALAGRRSTVRYIPYSPSGEPPGWVFEAAPRPRVLVTFGAGITARELVSDGALADSPVLRGLADLDVEVVLAVAAEDRAGLGPLPPAVRVVTDCPLTALLPGCAAVVHHGGNGTLLTAARYGVPQLILSAMPDLHFSARQFVPTGAVSHLMPEEVTRARVREELGRCLADPGRRRAAEVLRAEMLAQPLPGSRLAEIIEAC